MSYIQEWSEATARTNRVGLTVPHYHVKPEIRYLTDERVKEFPYVVRECLGELDFEDVVAQCISIHYRLLPVIEQWLQCSVIYTLGWIDDGTDKGMFKFDDAFIVDKLKNGCLGGSVSIHAWLTLPSMEVIDVSIATSPSVLNNIPEGRGGVIAQHADVLKGMTYKPMLVGMDFLIKAGLIEFKYQ